MSKFHFGDTTDPNLLYALQYQVTDEFFYLEHEGEKYVFLSALDIDAFAAHHTGDVQAVAVEPLRARIKDKSTGLHVALGLQILQTYDVNGEVTVPENFPLSLADGLRAAGVTFRVTADFMPERLAKTAKEIKYMANNCTATVKAFLYLEQILTEATIDTAQNSIIYNMEQVTSESLKREVSKRLLDDDLISPAGMVIAGGPQAAEPHNSGSGLLRPHETIVVDIFPQSTTNHYFADMTRTYVKGTPSDTIVKMYEAVAAAQQASLRALRPRRACNEVYAVSAEIIRDHGFDVGEKGYIHSLGHGLGVAVHEAPSLSPRSKTLLEPGHVVTVEPGLYYPEIGGVRIEDTVVITEDGFQNLTEHPQNWQIV